MPAFGQLSIFEFNFRMTSKGWRSFIN